MHKSTNPLRISQESLDLDDIISDLNSEHQSSVMNVAPQQIGKVEPAKTKTAGTNKLKVEGAAMKATGAKARPTTAASANKENDSLAINRQQEQPVSLSTAAKTKTNVAGASEVLLNTQATTNEKSQQQESSRRGGQRYSEALQQSPTSMTLEEDGDQLRQSAPFYLQKGASLSDEDVEGFQRRLDTLIVNFRSETLGEFMKTKRQVLSDQTQTIDAERRRCNTLLGVKQNEIEQLKESLANKTKTCEDLNTRCEGMAFWAGKSKTLLRIKLLQHNAFQGLKQNKEFSKHSKLVLEHKLREYRERIKRQVFLGWERHYKEWKVVKNRQDFDKAVKLELQHICAQYNKEIEGLREKLAEAQAVVDSEHRTKAMMQEQLKKAFMRGVCALNFEAMHILNPNDQQQHIEREMEKQVMTAMNQTAYSSPFDSHIANMACPPIIGAPNAPIYKSVSETFTPQSQSSLDLETNYLEKKMTQIDGPQPNPFSQNIVEEASLSLDYRKIESKDTMWKPAPIMGREINQQVVPSYTYSQPTITSQLRNTTSQQQQQQQSVVLSSHFTKLASSVTPQSINTDLIGVMRSTEITTTMPQASVRVLEEETQVRTLPGNPTVIQNYSSSLPDFVSLGGINNGSQGGEGKTIVANAPKTSLKSASVVATGKKIVGTASSGAVIKKTK